MRHDAVKVLKLVKKVEYTFSDFYKFLSVQYPLLSDAAVEFYRLSVEEKGHEALADYAIRILLKSSPQQIEFDINSLEDMLARIATLRRKVFRRSIDLKELIDELVALEVSAGEHALRLLPSQLENVVAKSLVEAMTAHEHTERLTRLGLSSPTL